MNANPTLSLMISFPILSCLVKKLKANKEKLVKKFSLLVQQTNHQQQQ